MKNKEILKQFKDTSEPIVIIGNEKVIGESVNELNNTVYIVEDSNGIRSVKLYNEVDQSKIPRQQIIEQRFAEKIQRLKEKNSKKSSHRQKPPKSST